MSDFVDYPKYNSMAELCNHILDWIGRNEKELDDLEKNKDLYISPIKFYRADILTVLMDDIKKLCNAQIQEEPANVITQSKIDGVIQEIEENERLGIRVRALIKSLEEEMREEENGEAKLQALDSANTHASTSPFSLPYFVGEIRNKWKGFVARSVTSNAPKVIGYRDAYTRLLKGLEQMGINPINVE